MKITYVEYNNKKSVFNILLVLLLGIILFTNPEGLVDMISFILAGFLVILSGINYFNYYKTKKKLNIENKSLFYISIILLILAVISLFLASFIETVFRLIIGLLLIYNGVMRTIYSFNKKEKISVFIVTLVISLLMFLLGFYVLLTTNLIYKTIGLFIIISAVLDLAGYIMNNKKYE